MTQKEIDTKKWEERFPIGSLWLRKTRDADDHYDQWQGEDLCAMILRSGNWVTVLCDDGTRTLLNTLDLEMHYERI